MWSRSQSGEASNEPCPCFTCIPANTFFGGSSGNRKKAMVHVRLVLLLGLLSGCGLLSKDHAPLPLVLDSLNGQDAAHYDTRKEQGAITLTIDWHRENALGDVSHAYLVPDLPPIRRYLANYYTLARKEGERPPFLSDSFRVVYGPYLRTGTVNPTDESFQMQFAGLLPGEYIVLLETQKEAMPEGSLSQPPSVNTKHIAMFREKVHATTLLAVKGTQVVAPAPQGNRNAARVGATVPVSEARDTEVIVCNTQETLIWPVGTVLFITPRPALKPSTLDTMAGAVLLPVIVVGGIVDAFTPSKVR